MWKSITAILSFVLLSMGLGIVLNSCWGGQRSFNGSTQSGYGGAPHEYRGECSNCHGRSGNRRSSVSSGNYGRYDDDDDDHDDRYERHERYERHNDWN